MQIQMGEILRGATDLMPLWQILRHLQFHHVHASSTWYVLPVDIQLGLGVGADEDGGLVVGDRVPTLVNVQLERPQILAGKQITRFSSLKQETEKIVWKIRYFQEFSIDPIKSFRGKHE